MADQKSKKAFTASERANPELDLRAELERLQKGIQELKIEYEQYFLGIAPLPPTRQHADLKRLIRTLIKAPFKTAAINYRLRSLEHRYQTFDTYWQRTLKQKEDGTYAKDLFKANLRERHAIEDAVAQTAEGRAEKSVTNLFTAYKEALEKQAGHKVKVDFQSFRKNLLQRAKDYKAKHGEKKLTFSVVVKDGKVIVRAKTKEVKPPVA